MKSIYSIVCISGVIALFLLAAPQTERVLAQTKKQDTTKETQEQKKPSSGFEDDDQSGMCLSAIAQAKLVASIVESYSRRFGACATSNPNFRDDCSVDFGRVIKSYNQYQFAVASVRNHAVTNGATPQSTNDGKLGRRLAYSSSNKRLPSENIPVPEEGETTTPTPPVAIVPSSVKPV